MLQAHSFLWHYLWVGPNFLLLVLGSRAVGARNCLEVPSLLSLSPYSAALGQLILYAADMVPFVSAKRYWAVDCADLALEAALKFLLIGEIFALVFGAYTSLARLGKLLSEASAPFYFLRVFWRLPTPHRVMPSHHLPRQSSGADHLHCRVRSPGSYFPFRRLFPSRMAPQDFRNCSRPEPLRLRAPGDVGND